MRPVYLEGFYAFFKGFVPSWFEIRSCSVFNLSHADEVGPVSLQIRFLQVLRLLNQALKRWSRLRDLVLACSCLKNADSLAVAIAFSMFDILLLVHPSLRDHSTLLSGWNSLTHATGKLPHAYHQADSTCRRAERAARLVALTLHAARYS